MIYNWKVCIFNCINGNNLKLIFQINLLKVDNYEFLKVIREILGVKF